MRFAWPEILWFYWALPVLVGLLVWWRARADRRLAAFAQGQLLGQLAATVDRPARILVLVSKRIAQRSRI